MPAVADKKACANGQTWKFRSICAMLAAISLSFAGCDECQNGFKFKYVASSDIWSEGSKDSMLDGSIRTYIFALKDARELEIRCFRFKPDTPTATFDLRYVINVPLLRRVVTDIQQGGPIELVLSVDGTPIGTASAQAISHDFGISFLGNISESLIDKIASAQTSVVVMPRQGGDRLDDIVEFGIADLASKITPVKKACQTLTAPSLPTATKPTSKT